MPQKAEAVSSGMRRASACSRGAGPRYSTWRNSSPSNVRTEAPVYCTTALSCSRIRPSSGPGSRVEATLREICSRVESSRVRSSTRCSSNW